MLVRKLMGSAGFVCLRCRLQQAGLRQGPSLSAAAGLPSPRYTRRHNGSYGTYTAATGAAEFSQEIDGSTNTESGAERTFESRPQTVTVDDGVDSKASDVPCAPSAPPPAASSRPPNRTYKSRGRLLSPEKEGLSVSILGKPGSAIVLREKRTRRKRRQRTDLEPAPHANPSVDPTSLLPDEGIDAASDDVLLNIHELRPQDTHTLPEFQFKKLKQSLLDGFTASQLAQYIREFQDTRRFAQDGGHERGSERAPWVRERQAWAPFVENAAEDAEPHLEGYITKGMTRKERLVTRLMRECWGISNQEVVDRDGSLSLTLTDPEFSLLTLGRRRWLEGTPRAILAHVKQVKLIRDSRTVHIVAPKHAAEAIVDRINRILSYARTTDFAVDLVSAEPIEPSVLDEVGRMTNTVTRLDSSGKKIVVTWIHMPERSENFENAAETVLRFLRDAYRFKTRVSSTLSIVPSDTGRQGRYLPLLVMAQKLPWQERLKKWERWTAALPGPGAGGDAQQARVPADILPFTTDAQQVTQVIEGSVDAPPAWSSELITDTTSVFGHVAFSRPSSPSTEHMGELDTSLPRTFIPAIPALGSLSLPSNLYEEGLWHSTIVIRFTVSPEISPDLIASAPDLELRIEADHKEIKRLTSLRAVAGTFTGDVLFPAAAVDARLVQQRYFQLPGESIEHYVPPIITFLANSDLRPWDGKLSTPPVLLGVRLPRRLLSLDMDNSQSTISTSDATTHTTSSSANTNSDNGSRSPANENNDDPVTVDYTLASIEVHRTVSAAYEGLKLRYTSIQAGQRGGERSELALDAVRVLDQQIPSEASSSHSSAPVGDEQPYDLVDEDDAGALGLGAETDAGAEKRQKGKPQNKRGYEYHVLNSPEGGHRGVATEPADAGEFLRVVSDIVNETGTLKWHAKRS